LAPVIEIVDKESGATHLEQRNISEDLRPSSESSETAIKRQADGHYRRTQQTNVKLSTTVLGDPSLLAKTVVEIQGLGQRLSGKYYVKEAIHKIDQSGYVTELKTLRDGHGQQGGVPSKGKPNRTNAQDHDPNALHPVEVPDRETGKTHIEYRDMRGRVSGVEDSKAGVSRPVRSG
jgi:hypothetical protein